MEAQGKTLIQQRAELEAAAQAQQQEYAALQLEVRRLRKELQERELERELAEIAERLLGTRSGTSSPTSAPMTVRDVYFIPKWHDNIAIAQEKATVKGYKQFY